MILHLVTGLLIHVLRNLSKRRHLAIAFLVILTGSLSAASQWHFKLTLERQHIVIA